MIINQSKLALILITYLVLNLLKLELDYQYKDETQSQICFFSSSTSSLSNMLIRDIQAIKGYLSEVAHLISTQLRSKDFLVVSYSIHTILLCSLTKLIS